MAIQSPRSRSGISLTLRVLQFVRELRRRLRPRGHADYASALGTRMCASLETKTFRRLEKELSQLGSHDRKAYPAADRVYKNRNKQRPRSSSKLHTRGQLHAVSAGKLQQTINPVDKRLSPKGSSLSAIASNDHLFLKQKTDISFEACSLDEIIQLLIVVDDAIRVLCSCRLQYNDEWLIALGREAGINFDAVFIANYEHLLVRLRTQLIAALSRKVLDALLTGGYDKKQQKLLSWFTEFAEKPQVLSTFPWTIKPSLAVLWGVCWMFYNPTVQAGDNPRVSRDALLQNGALPGWRLPEPTDCEDTLAHESVSELMGTDLSLGMELTGALQPSTLQRVPQNPDGIGLSGVDLRSRNTGTWMPTNLESRALRQDVSRVTNSRKYRGGQGSDLGTYGPQFPATFDVDNPNLNFLPEIQGNATDLIVFPQQLDGNFPNPWQQSSHTSLPQRTARRLTTSIPSVRVTDAAPHPFASFPDLYSPHTPTPQAPSLNVDTNFPEFNSSFSMTTVPPPEVSPVHAFQTHRHERTPSIISNSNIPTPISMSGSRSPLLSPADGRTCSPASPYSQVPLRRPSEDASSQGDPEEAGSPRRNHAYKRAEEPPRNHDGKMVCKQPECAGLMFDRKCEWSKHMDKHDRPYKCTVKGCEKLQGFTYSGGLLRHEREVHKMHGGTKKSLFCPFADCKRSSGSGFTRKENLAEHIRRVHRRTSISVDLGHLIIPREQRQGNTTTEVRVRSDSPYQQDESELTLKRKRLSEVSIQEEDDQADLRAELKRLRQENEEKDARLHQLEAAVMALQQRR